MSRKSIQEAISPGGMWASPFPLPAGEQFKLCWRTSKGRGVRGHQVQTGPSTAQHLYSVSPFSSLTTTLKLPTHPSCLSPLPVRRALRPPSSHGPAFPPGSRCLGPPPPAWALHSLLTITHGTSSQITHRFHPKSLLVLPSKYIRTNHFSAAAAGPSHPRLNRVSSRRLTAPQLSPLPCYGLFSTRRPQRS